MAMYHFRLKSDKKPSGAKVSAVKHVEYINREGTFAHDEQWKEKNKFVGDFITTEEKANVVGGRNALLYKTDEFGSIRNSELGLEVTENASSTTISITLMVAEEAMGHKALIIGGSERFRQKVLEVAVAANLPVNFCMTRKERHREQRCFFSCQNIIRRIFLTSQGLLSPNLTSDLKWLYILCPNFLPLSKFYWSDVKKREFFYFLRDAVR